MYTFKLYKQLFFHKSRLRTKILRGYSIPIFLSIISAIIVYFQGVVQVKNQSQRLSLFHENISHVKDLAFSISSMEKSARGYLIKRNKSELAAYEKWDTAFYEQSEKIRQLITDTRQRENLNQIIEVGDRMNEFYRRLISYIELKKPEKAQQIWGEGKVQALTANLSELVRNFELQEQKNLAEQKKAQENALNLLTTVVFGLTGISTLLAIAFAIKISSAISRQMNQETSAIASSSAEIAATMTQQERNSIQQASSVNETTNSLDQLNTSLRYAKEQAENSALAASQALRLSQTGTQAVERTLTKMATLKTKVGEIAEHTIKLTDNSSQIETIIRLVSEIATQTNMLALNAAIEAVRAGEQGKGFAVVAQEIRRLADRSKKSTAEVDALLNAIRQEIQSTVLVTKTGTKTVEEGVIIAQEMATTLTGVTDAVETVVDNNQQLSLNVTEQASAIKQVVTAMNQINQAAQENVSGVAQVREGSQKLNQALQNLQALV
ncbi:methyl-accepting chemotaxis protein [Aerosakkonemataceae cyanobacterium BLCC-F154]|uniref:Methyl-accepting chemotaxis protein n=1 Tax=Floridaenema fluviatile BLCC-F154 TaxID=3153640 RepID=A0ABV4YE54_9CYAN